jgi:hypothetical protein
LTSLASSFSVSLGPILQHLGGLWRPPVNQHAFQTANDDDGQDDALVFVGFELAAQALGGFPDVGSEIVELGFVERESPDSAFS